MDFDFKEMRDRIKLTDVVWRYGIRLRIDGKKEYGSAACPLPTHPEDRNNNCFCVHLVSNRWICKHPRCAARNGLQGKWGDCINFVMAIGKIDAKPAARQLEAWFPNKKPAPQSVEPEAGIPHPNRLVIPQSAVAVKTPEGMKYTEKVRQWFDTIWPKKEGESDADYKHRLLHDITSALIQNYKSGRAGRQL